MLDLSIVYPDGKNSAWDLICGRIPWVIVHVEKLEIPREFLGKDYSSDPEFKAAFQTWVNQIWEEKDALIADIKAKHQLS